MERGLLWLPLLGLFIGLAWAGRNEYQKLEAYKLWATDFERAKYDIYAVLGQREDCLTWGTPTPRGPINLETLSLKQVESVDLLVNRQPSSLETPPQKGKAMLQLRCRDQTNPVEIPFTDPALAAKWGQYLETVLQQNQ